MLAHEKIRRWRQDPIAFVRENFETEPDPAQREILENIGGPQSARRRVGMKACTGAGKSTALAWCGLHRLACFGAKGEHPKGAAVSGEGADNLRDNLWSELSKWLTRSEFLKAAFTWTRERVFAKDHPETWFLAARSYAKDADTEAVGRSLSGLHSKYPFILLDEIGDAPHALLNKAEQIFTGEPEDALIAAAGNPTSTTGLLYHICSLARAGWAIITITADPDDPKRTSRVSAELARQQIEKYGRDNPWVMATILGQFPPSGFNTLLSPDEVEAAMNRHLREPEYDWAQKRLGIDVARFGDDRTVIFPRQGLAAFKPVVLRHALNSAASVDIATRVMAAKTKWGSEMEFFDDTVGWAHGAVDVMRSNGCAPIPVNFAGKAPDPRYKNMRVYIWLKMAEWIKNGGCLPKMPELVRELSSPTYSYANGQFVLEDKDQIKKRLGFSPDLADALALTFAIPDRPSRFVLPGMPDHSKMLSDYDPYASV